MISASRAVAHDIWSNVVKHDQSSEHEEVCVGRIAAVTVGAIAIVLAILAAKAFNMRAGHAVVGP